MSEVFVEGVDDTWINVSYVSQFRIYDDEEGFHLRAHMVKWGEWEELGVYDERKGALDRLLKIMESLKCSRG